MKMASWFEVDREGLAKLVERRGKAFVVHELLQNAWDTECSEVTVKLVPMPGRSMAELIVTDDHPDGFKELSHAYTLFAESEKKANVKRRGRFNFGEKLVLALCETARISTTTGIVTFDHDGRHMKRSKRHNGSEFKAVVRMTRNELEKVLCEIKNILPPPHIRTIINDENLPARTPATVIKSAMLYTEIADENGILRRRLTDTEVELYVPRQGEKATLYEMGIPVMELGDDPYHVNVQQKIPLTMERDAAPQSYLRDVRALVMNKMHEYLSREQTSAKWANEAIEQAHPTAVRHVIETRFGKAVIADPSDHEAENIAKSQGFSVIAGGTFSAQAWSNIKEAGALLPAGQVTPSPKPFHPDGDPLTLIPSKDWTNDMTAFADFADWMARQAADLTNVTVHFTSDTKWGFNAAYSHFSGSSNGQLTVNAGALGASFFEAEHRQEQIRLLLHELAHHSGHHLESSYHEALCRIGAKLAMLAAINPGMFIHRYNRPPAR